MSKNTPFNVEAFPPQPLEISLGDLSVAVEIIDVVTKRGAFNGEELHSVGALRNKFVEFIKVNSKKKQEEPKSDGTPPPVSA